MPGVAPWMLVLASIVCAGCNCRGGIPCGADTDCEDDGEFCTREICSLGRCTELFNVCDVGFACNERRDVCVWVGDSGPQPDADVDAGPCADMSCWPELTLELDGVFLFIRSSCADECDPAGGAECLCGGVCADRLRAGSVHLDMERWGATAGLCLVACEPSLEDDACERPFHSCDPQTGTCQQACRSSDECRLVVDAAGEVRVDPDLPNECDFVTGRCRMPGTPGARAGDACAEDADCMDDGTCLSDGAWGAEGYCARFDCQWSALACPEGEVCERRDVDRPACLRGCLVGAEPEEARLGPGGHGDGCPPGLACRWWEGAALEPEGACVPGNYNAILEPSFGAPCTRDDECYSPYGYGRCLGAAAGRAGICTVRECFVGRSPLGGEYVEGLYPGVAASLPVCPAAAMDLFCAELGGTRWCLPTCTSAAQCAAGFACVDVGGGVSACYTDCASDGECRPGEACAAADGAACGGGPACRCQPAS